MPLQDIYKQLASYLKSTDVGIGFGGVGAYDVVECKAALAVAGVYECTVTVNAFAEHCYVHTFPPSRGQIERMAEHIGLVNEQVENETGLLLPASIAILALAGKEHDITAQNLTILGNDVVLFGFLKFMSDMVSQKDTARIKQCRHALRRIRCKFIPCQEGDPVEQKKWELESTTQSVASNQTLRGWKKVQGYAQVRSSLQDRCMLATPEAISSWLKKGWQLLRYLVRMN